MKAVIFAGGTGTRLWPLSRKKSPKQFEKLIDNKSTLQLAVERLKPEFRYEDIYIATNAIYKKTVQDQLPLVPKKNFIFEPEKKDVGPAIALVMGILSKMFPKEPVAIIWSDHLVKEAKLFRSILHKSGEFIKANPDRIIFIGHKPRYASTNLGYINYNLKSIFFSGQDFFGFEGFKYKPDQSTAKRFFHSGKYAWNLGYFVTSAEFLYQEYSRLAPEIYINIEKIISRIGQKDFEKTLKQFYGKVKSISFDNAILEKLDKKNALVIVEDVGWSDIGAWESLKEALETHQYENVIRGKVHLEHVRDSLIYNYEDKKLIVGIDLDENIIVNTNDVLLITKKTSVGKLSELIKNFEGTENEKLT